MVRIGNITLPDFPIVLAPMEDVSDPPFRVLCKEQGADLMFTEFISSEGLIRSVAKSMQKLDIYEEERPVGVQIFGAEKESMIEATEVVLGTSPDLIDINFGCPVKKVVCKGAGAAILKDIPKMVELSAEIVKRSTLPVTVKTRLGWDADNIRIVEVAERLQDVGISAISIHGRTRTQMYKGKADWSHIARVKENPRMHIPVFGNGDIDTPQKAYIYKEKYGVDGIMIGRAAIGNPWIFAQIKHYLRHNTPLPPPTITQRAEVCKRHLTKSIQWKGERVGILEMRRHYSKYFKGIPHTKPYICAMVQSTSCQEIQDVISSLVRTQSSMMEVE